jgi:hypothetical protein
MLKEVKPVKSSATHSLMLTYKDSDGDEITLLSDKELQQFYTSGVPTKFVVRDMSLLQPPAVG